MTQARITRSTGIDVPFPGPRPGGGMTGATPTLDAMVASAAEALRELFGRDVEIRFNSDRMSGGAFLKDEEDARKFGVCVRLEPKEERPDEMDFQEWKRVYDAAPKFPQVYINVGTARLVDKALATQGSTLRHPYAYLPQESVEAALSWVREHTLRLDGDSTTEGDDR